MAWIAAGLTAETVLLTVAGFAWFFFRGYSFAEACAAGIVSMFILFSLIHQLSYLAGWPWLGWMLEGLALTAAFFFVHRRWTRLMAFFFSVRLFFREEKAAGGIFFSVFLIIAISIALGWISTDYGAAPISYQAHALFQPAAGGPLAPLNTPGLFNHTARFGLSPNSCGFGLLGMMAVCFSTYALARRYAWPPMALTVSLLVLSMPRLVFLAAAPTGELLFTAAACLAMVMIYRLVEQHRVSDFYCFVLCICFSIMDLSFSITLASVLLLLLIIVMIRRHGWLICRELAAGNKAVSMLVLMVALVLAQIPVVTLNLKNGDPFFGFSYVPQNDGIFGAMTNLIRYSFSSIDPTEAIQVIVHWLLGVDLKRFFLDGFAFLTGLVPGKPAGNIPFCMTFSGSGDAGFGPLALLLVVPSMVHALARGTRRLKATVVAWTGYLYITSLVAGWHSRSLETLTPLFAANSFIVAFSLPPWRLRRRGLRGLQFGIALIALWSLWCFL